jgi:hypothetical protein
MTLADQTIAPRLERPPQVLVDEDVAARHELEPTTYPEEREVVVVP